MPDGSAAPRSCLCVPGSSPRMIDKALASDADEVVVDLEDAVTLDAKEEARAIAVAALEATPLARRVAVRVNAVGTAWCHLDLIALASSSRVPDSIVVPKVSGAGDIAFVERLLLGLASATGTPPPRLQALIESAGGLLEAPAIAAASPLMEALIVGYADLAADLGRPLATASWSATRDRILWAARASALRAVDGPYLEVTDDAGFEDAVSDALTAGFDAKWVIHPQQIARVNEAFTPSDAQLTWAHQVLDTLDQAARAGLGAVSLDGSMLDEAVAVSARRILAKGAAR